MKWDVATYEELKHSAFRVILMGFGAALIMGIFFFILSKNLILCAFISFGLIVVCIFGAIIILKRDWIDDKVGLFYSEFQGISYQGSIFFLLISSIGLSFGFFGLGLFKGNCIYSAISFGSVVYFPSIFMLLRIKVYRNENSRLLLVEDEYGDSYYKQVIGYHPIFYYLTGITFCRGPFGVSLHELLDSIFLHTYPLINSVFWFILCFIVGCLLLSPDILNKILPFELKTVDGLKKYLFGSIVVMGLILCAMLLD